jgi:RNA polymerase sigma-70 factor (ECF subfamily)
MIADNSDILLLQQLNEGDATAFTLLYNQYRNWLRFVAQDLLQDEMEAQDLVQEFFIDFWEKRLFTHIDPSYDKGNGTLIRNYLFKAIRNRCLNQLQRKKIKSVTLNESTLQESLYITEHFLENKDLQLQLHTAFSHVPAQSARVFQKAYLQHKTRNEIAAEMGISPHTVKNLLGTALKILRPLLKKSYSPASPSPAKNVY